MEPSEWHGRPGFSLSASSEGFTMRYPLGRSRYCWSDIDGDFVVAGGSLCFRLQPARRSPVGYSAASSAA